MTAAGGVVDSSMNVVGYIRVSGAGQVDKDGPVRQAEKIKAFCAEHGLQQISQVQDLAITGKMDGLDRPGFAEFLNAFDDKASVGSTAMAVVVERNDRWARDLIVSELMLKELRSRGLKLFFCDQGLVDQADDKGDPTKTLIRQILSALAEWDRSMQVLKLAGARARIRAKTGRCEGIKPYGTKPGESEILATIERFREDKHSWEFIAEALNRGGLKTRGGKLWIRQNVQSIWKNASPVDKLPEPGH